MLYDSVTRCCPNWT